MKKFGWILVLLCGLFSSCQTSKSYTGSNGWGSYAATEVIAEDGDRTAGPETATALATQAGEFTAEPALFPLVPAIGQKKNNARLAVANPPENTVSLSVKVGNKALLPEPLRMAQSRQVPKLAIAGLAASALAFLPFVAGISLLFGLPLALAGGWMSLRAIRKINADPETYRGLGVAKAGFGIAVVVLAMLLLFGVAALVVG